MVRVFNRLFRLSRNKAKDMVAARFALWVWQTTRARQAWLKRTRAARKGGRAVCRRVRGRGDPCIVVRGEEDALRCAIGVHRPPFAQALELEITIVAAGGREGAFRADRPQAPRRSSAAKVNCARACL